MVALGGSRFGADSHTGFDRETGMGLAPPSAVFTLRERHRKYSKGVHGSGSMVSLAYVIKAWNYFLCNVPLKAFKPSRDFPQFIDYPNLGDNRDQIPNGTPDDRVVVVRSSAAPAVAPIASTSTPPSRTLA